MSSDGYYHEAVAAAAEFSGSNGFARVCAVVGTAVYGATVGIVHLNFVSRWAG